MLVAVGLAWRIWIHINQAASIFFCVRFISGNMIVYMCLHKPEDVVISRKHTRHTLRHNGRRFVNSSASIDKHPLLLFVGRRDEDEMRS